MAKLRTYFTRHVWSNTLADRWRRWNSAYGRRARRRGL
jgi:hypothetical protein